MIYCYACGTCHHFRSFGFSSKKSTSGKTPLNQSLMATVFTPAQLKIRKSAFRKIFDDRKIRNLNISVVAQRRKRTCDTQK